MSKAAPRNTARVLAGPPPSAGTESLKDHRARLGPMPQVRHQEDAVALLEASGLLGRGGAGFPVGKKWRSVAGHASGNAVVVVNGAESEPASSKDRTLMVARPQLILDGAQLAATAVGADEIVVYVGVEHTRARAAMAHAIAERASERSARRPTPIHLVEAPLGYVAGEASAAVHYINARDARPTNKPPRISEVGVRGRPTLVQNVESLAHAALIARHGAEWFRSAGQGQTRGTAVITVSGSVTRPGVREIDLGTTIAEVAAYAGGAREGLQAVLLGGYFGAWSDLAETWDMPLDPVAMRARNLSFGSGVVSFLPADACGVSATARIMAFMAGESAKQCGPCLYGLRAIADATQRLAIGGGRYDDLVRLERWSGQIAGRGACGLPDGAVAFFQSALRVFSAEFRLHQAARRCSHPRAWAGVA